MAAVKVINNGPDRTLLKWVKKANMWCITKFENGKQIQTWSSEKPTGE